MARELWRNAQGLTSPTPDAVNHWKSCGEDLSRVMDTISSGENILETIFSFQSEQLEVFVNTEGAVAEDVGLKLNPEDGGFELTVARREPHLETCIRRLYSFQRPLHWEQAKASVSAEGILHVVVPGPPIQCQPFPINPCF